MSERLICIKCGDDYLEHQVILSEADSKRCLCLNCWNKMKEVEEDE